MYGKVIYIKLFGFRTYRFYGILIIVRENRAHKILNVINFVLVVTRTSISSYSRKKIKHLMLNRNYD